MNSKVLKIMDVLNTIEYGFLDENGINIFNDDSNVKCIFNKVYYLMSPDELIKEKYGVCWDQVELERKLFSETNIEFKTYFIYIDDHKSLPSHTFLVYKDNNKYYWFEHSWFDERGIHEYDNLNKLLNEVVEKHIKANNEDIKGKFDTFIYEYNQPNYNISCDKFYEFIFKQKKIYNYTLESSTENDIEEIKHYKLKSITDYVDDLSDKEMNKIELYIKINVPKQIKDYKNIKYNGKIIGCLLILDEFDKVLLDEIYIEKEYRKKGIGSSIIKNIINSKNKNIYLWVYKKNTNAFNVYLKLGFKIIEENDTRFKMEYQRNNILGL